MTELIASGPLRYFGGTIETFALPMGTFIVIAWVLFYIYRRPHDVPRLKYLRPAHQIALGTREPGTEGLVYVPSSVLAPSAAAPQAAAAPGTEAPAQAQTQAPAETGAPAGAEVPGAAPEASSAAEHDGTSTEGETF